MSTKHNDVYRYILSVVFLSCLDIFLSLFFWLHSLFSFIIQRSIRESPFLAVKSAFKSFHLTHLVNSSLYTRSIFLEIRINNAYNLLHICVFWFVGITLLYYIADDLSQRKNFESGVDWEETYYSLYAD